MAFIFYLIPIALYLLYKWSISNYDYFQKQGIAYRKPLPLFGTNINFLTRKKNFMDTMNEWYYEFPNEKVSGLFEFRNPLVLVKDPKLVKQIGVKEIDSFIDHRSAISEDIDPLFGRALVSLKGQKWKDMRATLSPAFTGSKMRQMFDFVSTVGEQTALSMKKEIKKGGENSFEFKELAIKFAVDVIASCAFGIEVDSFTSPDNDFHRIAKKLTNFTSTRTILVFLGYMLFPAIMKRTNLKVLDRESTEFFEKAILETMRIREEKGIIRHDMIHLLLQAKKGQLSHQTNQESHLSEKLSDGFATVEESNVGKSEVSRKWEDLDLAAQAFIFFLAGFDTIATAMSFMAYELVCNRDVQQKLYEEIFEMNQELDGKRITYEKLQSMKYLDQTVSETLRKWPPAPVTDRRCVKDFDLKFDNKKLHFEADSSCFFPIWNFHRDPKYFPNPEKFDPERFNEENRKNIDPDTYLPFGIGPRNCIGSRFALMELKTFFYYLLLTFSFELADKTEIPLKFAKIPFNIKPENGIWVQLKPRSD